MGAGRKDAYNRELFAKISAKSNYTDEKMVETVYNGILKVLAQELKEGNEVFLPNFGKFWLDLGQNPNTREPIWVLKFRVCTKLRKYLRNKQTYGED